MGFGKYSRRDRIIVQKIELCRTKQYYHKKKFKELQEKIDGLLLKVPQNKYSNVKTISD